MQLSSASSAALGTRIWLIGGASRGCGGFYLFFLLSYYICIAPPASRYQETTRLDSFIVFFDCFPLLGVTDDLRVIQLPGLRVCDRRKLLIVMAGAGLGGRGWAGCSVRWSTPRSAADSCRRSCLRPVAWHMGTETGIKRACPELLVMLDEGLGQVSDWVISWARFYRTALRPASSANIFAMRRVGLQFF